MSTNPFALQGQHSVTLPVSVLNVRVWPPGTMSARFFWPFIWILLLDLRTDLQDLWVSSSEDHKFMLVVAAYLNFNTFCPFSARKRQDVTAFFVYWSLKGSRWVVDTTVYSTEFLRLMSRWWFFSLQTSAWAQGLWIPLCLHTVNSRLCCGKTSLPISISFSKKPCSAWVGCFVFFNSAPSWFLPNLWTNHCQAKLKTSSGSFCARPSPFTLLSSSFLISCSQTLFNVSWGGFSLRSRHSVSELTYKSNSWNQLLMFGL